MKIQHSLHVNEPSQLTINKLGKQSRLSSVYWFQVVQLILRDDVLI